MSSFIKKLLLPVYSFLRYCSAEPDFVKKLFSLRTKEKKVILIGSPIHGNVGDHLICEVEKQFINKEFSDYCYIDCTMPFSRYFLGSILKNLNTGDYLMISGGGWLGTEWIKHENFVRKILARFQKGNLVILPQTVYYRKIDDYVKEGAEVYRKNKNFLFCVRERASYEFLIQNRYSDENNTYLMPDFALYYGAVSKRCQTNTDKVNVCLRDDIEISLSNAEREKIELALKNSSYQVCRLTTNTRGLIIKPKYRNQAIKHKIDEISDCCLLITDRLHAMIMAALSGTPCIAFDNSTHKVAGVYKWIEYLDYVHLYQDGEDISELITKMTADRMTPKQYSFEPLRKYYQELTEKLKSMEG